MSKYSGSWSEYRYKHRYQIYEGDKKIFASGDFDNMRLCKKAMEAHLTMLKESEGKE